MKSMLVWMLVFAWFPAVVFACPRPSVFPKELPLSPCPLRAVDVGCDRCLPNQRHVTAFYAGEPAAIGDAYAKALRADGWKLEVTARAFSEPARPGESVLTITGKRGNASLSTLVVVEKARDHTRLVIVFTPG